MHGYGTEVRRCVGFAEISVPMAFCEAEQRFLLLFLEKEEIDL
jgi:hypothetical protein